METAYIISVAYYFLGYIGSYFWLRQNARSCVIYSCMRHDVEVPDMTQNPNEFSVAGLIKLLWEIAKGFIPIWNVIAITLQLIGMQLKVKAMWRDAMFR